MPKYIYVNGVMKLNPNYKPEKGQSSPPPQTVANKDQALAIISSTSDIQEATTAAEKATGKPMQLAPVTISSMEAFESKEFLAGFKSDSVEGAEMLDKVTEIFSKYEVPIGLLRKLLDLQHYKIHFKIDDSSSMGENTDSNLAVATPFIRNKVEKANKSRITTNSPMTRWEEAEDRLHVLIDLLAYIPTKTIKISFLNRGNVILLNHEGKTPEKFAEEAHQQILEAFLHGPRGGTPTKKHLIAMFEESTEPTMNNLMTDGVPNDASIHEIGALVITRKNPHLCPLTFMSCTGVASEAEWMKEIEEIAPFTAELDDFNGEKEEVLKDQGPAFPFTKGVWLLCNLVAAINPNDLDALDESNPFTKGTMDDIMGRVTTDEEYSHYFYLHPQARTFQYLLNQFKRTDIVAKDIDDVSKLSERNRKAEIAKSPYKHLMDKIPPMPKQAKSKGLLSSFASMWPSSSSSSVNNDPPPPYEPPANPKSFGLK